MTDKTPFITESIANRIPSLKLRGAATTRRLQNPATTVTFKRIDPTTGEWNQVGVPVHLIKIALDSRISFGASERPIEISTTGKLSAFADEVTDAINIDDVFEWQNQTCRVSGPIIERNGRINASFELAVTNQ